MRALLVAIALLLLAAPAAGAQDAVDRAIEALGSDHVYVAPGAQDILPSAEADQLRARIGGRSLYVAVLPDDAGPPEEIAPAIANGLGREGTYAILVGENIQAGPTTTAQEAAEDAAAEGGSAAAVLDDFVDRLENPPEEDSGSGAGGLILLGLAGAGGAAVLVSRRRRRRAEAKEFAEVKENARDDLVALGDDIRALDLEIELPGASAEAREDYARAVGAYERANDAWKLARRPDDLEPVGAALEEGRWAMASSKARLEDREPPERRSPCFFDPRHGPSTREVEWAPEYGEPRMVPACEADAERVERGDDPEAREVLVGGRRVPYWNAGPMYAPFAGGFFGAGLLPGLMLGTMMGGSMGWGAPYDAGGGGDFGGGDFGGGDFGGGFGGGDFGG